MEDTTKPTITLSFDDLKNICTIAYHGIEIVRNQQIVADVTQSAEDRDAAKRQIATSTQMINEWNDCYISFCADDLINTLACH